MASSTTIRYRLMANPNTYSRITCSAYGCDMRSGTNKLSKIKMFTFPRDPLRRRRWELATRRANWRANSKSRLCSKHFITGKPSKDPKHPDYIPSVFVFTKNTHNSKSAKSKARGNSTSESCGNSHLVSSSCGIKGFCGKCFSSESVSSAFSQSLAPLNQTLSQLMDKLKDMEEEREQLRNELALCREEIQQLREIHPHSTSMHSKPNRSTSVDETEILESMYSDYSSDECDSDLLPSQYLEQIYQQRDKQRKNKRKKIVKSSILETKDDSSGEYDSDILPAQYVDEIDHQTDEPCKNKRQKKLAQEIPSEEDMNILDQSQKKKRVNPSHLKSKGSSESPKDEKSDTGSPITIVYLKR